MRKTSLDCVYELAQQDKRVLFIGSDLGPGVLADFKRFVFSVKKAFIWFFIGLLINIDIQNR